MTLFNADGSMAEMSGNGVRCLAAAVRRATHARRGASWSSTRCAGAKTVDSR